MVDLSEYDPNVTASLLKLYFRELPDPLISPRVTAKLEAAAGESIYTESFTGSYRGILIVHR